MLAEIEDALRQYVSTEWSEADVLFWIGKKRFALDVPAIDTNLRAPLADFLLCGGKRSRPTLFLTILGLFGADWKQRLDLAVALELAHNATLIIDDIEDSAELRRGKPTCHKTFGLDTAVNTGTAAHLLPMRLLMRAKGLTEKQKLRLMEVYAEEILNVYFGQTLDIAWHKAPRAHSVEEYLEMTRLKTGGLVRMATRAACIVADREDLEAAMVDFSELAGVAFQIKDDALEFTGDEATFGKSFGNDISEGKMSLPVTLALGKLPADESAALLRTLGAHTRDRAELRATMDTIRGTGAVDEAVAYAEKLVDDAWNALSPKLTGMPEEAVAAFKAVTYGLVKRSK